MSWDPWVDPQADTYSTSFPIKSRRKSSVIPGASNLHHAIHPTFSTTLQNNLLSYLSYVKTQDIPILPVTKPDIRSVLGQGASFLVNGVEMPTTYVDPSSGTVFPQGMVLAYKRAVLERKEVQDMDELIEGRIQILFNELYTMHHPPLRAHPNIVNLLGVGFEIEGPADALNAMPVLVPECAELGNFAEVLESARKEDRPLNFEAKISLCLDIAHGIEILHACDIVHGDVKCENVLIFEHDNEEVVTKKLPTELFCKLTDFGVSRLPEERVQLGGSRPWQAPECSRSALFGIEEAKRTDIYSFGMLLWRVMLDGDPFKSLGELQGQTPRERRHYRNEAIGKLKDDDRLVQHVCESLAMSELFTKTQLRVLSEVISITLLKNSAERELDIRRIIKLLTPNSWFEERHPMPPARMPLEIDANLLDLEKWYSEFESVSPVVQSLIASGYRNLAQRTGEQFSHESEDRQSAAAYQLAICYANGFGVPVQLDQTFHWLNVAATLGSQKAHEALPPLVQALQIKTPAFADPFSKSEDGLSAMSSSWASDFNESKKESIVAPENSLVSRTNSLGINGSKQSLQLSYMVAAETCNYEALDALILSGATPSTTADGVSPLHFLSSWNVSKAESLGRRLIAAGASINASAKKGATVGGTPLMWSVFGDHILHSQILLNLGADPMVATPDGEDALSFAARLHLVRHLRLLLENVRPVLFRDQISRLVENAVGGVSRFTRVLRHGENWAKTADETLDVLQKWNNVFHDTEPFPALLLPALRRGLQTPYGRINTDIQMKIIKRGHINPAMLTSLLKDAVLTYNTDFFASLMSMGIPVNEVYEGGKTLLHLCAKIPDHNLAATQFAIPLLKQGALLEARDANHITPWMEAMLERKWDLADLYMERGAEPLSTDINGTNILGLCIETLNLGAIKYLFKYCAAKQRFLTEAFLVNSNKQLSALQLAASLQLPRSHGMKIEVVGVFLTIMKTLATDLYQIDFRSDGLLPNATALDIAASLGNVHAVKNLVKRGASLSSSKSALELIRIARTSATDYMTLKNLERCAYIIENWAKDEEGTRQLADDWTNMRTIDESKVNSSWEVVVFNYKARKAIVENSQDVA